MKRTDATRGRAWLSLDRETRHPETGAETVGGLEVDRHLLDIGRVLGYLPPERRRTTTA